MQQLILRLADLIEVTKLSRSTLLRRVKAGEFPQPVRLGPLGTTSKGWRASDVEAWLADLN